MTGQIARATPSGGLAADPAHTGLVDVLLPHLAHPSVDAFAAISAVTAGETVLDKIKLCASLAATLAGRVAEPATQLATLLVVLGQLSEQAPPEGVAIADGVFAGIEAFRIRVDGALQPALRHRLVKCLCNVRSRLQLADSQPLYLGTLKARLSNTTADLLPGLSGEVARQAGAHGLAPQELWVAVMDRLGQDYGNGWSARGKRDEAIDKVRQIAEAQGRAALPQQRRLIGGGRAAGLFGSGTSQAPTPSTSTAAADKPLANSNDKDGGGKGKDGGGKGKGGGGKGKGGGGKGKRAVGSRSSARTATPRVRQPPAPLPPSSTAPRKRPRTASSAAAAGESSSEGDGAGGGARGSRAGSRELSPEVLDEQARIWTSRASPTPAPSSASILIRSGAVAPDSLVSRVMTVRRVCRERHSARSPSVEPQHDEQEAYERELRGVEAAFEAFLVSVAPELPDDDVGPHTRGGRSSVVEEAVEELRSLFLS